MGGVRRATLSLRAWADLLHSVETGQNAARHVLGMTGWEYRQQHPEQGAVFDRAMSGNSRCVAASVLSAYDFGRFSTIVDVGGGQGAFLAAILSKYPNLRGVLFDQPHVVTGAAPVLRSAGVTNRCRIVGGSFFEAVPEGGDAYVLKYVLPIGRTMRRQRSCGRAVAQSSPVWPWWLSSAWCRRRMRGPT